MDCSFEVWVNGTGDAWSFSWAGSDGNVSNSAVNSYSIVSYFWAGTLTYAFNNVTISSVSLPAASVNGSVWRKVRILWNNGVLKVWFDNALLLSYTDTDQARL